MRSCSLQSRLILWSSDLIVAPTTQWSIAVPIPRRNAQAHLYSPIASILPRHSRHNLGPAKVTIKQSWGYASGVLGWISSVLQIGVYSTVHLLASGVIRGFTSNRGQTHSENTASKALIWIAAVRPSPYTSSRPRNAYYRSCHSPAKAEIPLARSSAEFLASNHMGCGGFESGCLRELHDHTTADESWNTMVRFSRRVRCCP